MQKQITVRSLIECKQSGGRFCMLTAYDYTSANLASAAGIPVILVGDSMGMTVMGLDSTIGVTLDNIIFACQAVKRGANGALVVADMPFMATEPNAERALENAAMLIQKGGADAVKLEGGNDAAERIERIVNAGIPVMGHIGFKPQSIKQFGRYSVKGKSDNERTWLLENSLEIEKAGAFAVVLELVMPTVAREISQQLQIPTIGIGSGDDTDAQVQVFHDLTGLTPKDKRPRHAKVNTEAGDLMKTAIAKFKSAFGKDL